MEVIPSMTKEEFCEESILIDIEDGNNDGENNDSDENEEGNYDEENYEDDDNEGNNDQQGNDQDEGNEVEDNNDDQENYDNSSDEEGNNNDDSEEEDNDDSDEEDNDDSDEEGNNDDQVNNDNDDEEESNSKNENYKNNGCEDDNGEQSDASSNNGESEGNGIEDTQRVRVGTQNQQHVETRVDVQYIQQTKNGSSCEKKSSTYNETPQTSNAHKKHNCKKWKGKRKSNNTSDGRKVREPCRQEGHKAYNKSGTCRKDVAGIKEPPNNKSLDASGGSLKGVNNSVQQNNPNPKDQSISKGGNVQGWKNTSHNNSSKNNSNKSSSGSDYKYVSSNDSNSKGKDNQDNTWNNNRNKGGNNNNKNQNKQNNNNKNQNKCNNIYQQKNEPAPKPFLKEAKEVINMILKDKLSMHPLDSTILKFHYRLAVLLFMMLYSIIQSSWIWKESIFCVYGNNAEKEAPYHVKNYCLSYPFVYESRLDQDQRRYLLFYRWTHHSFFILAFLFYIPRIVAKFLGNHRLNQLLLDLAQGERWYDTSNWKEDTSKMLQYMKSHASTHGYLYFWLLICHMVALAIDLAAVFYLDYMLQGRFINLMYSAYPLQRNPQFFTDYLSDTFPPFVNCKLERRVLINNEREDMLACYLFLMDIYDKMFVVIWFWLVFLIFCTTITLFGLVLLVIPPFNRLFLFLHTDSKHMKKIRNKIVKKYCVSDLYVLYLMKCHRSESQFCMLMTELLHSEESCDMSLALGKKKSSVSFKDEMMSKADHLLESSPSLQKEQWCTKNTLHYSPIFSHDEVLRSRRVNTSTPCPDYDADIFSPRNFMKQEYKV